MTRGVFLVLLLWCMNVSAQTKGGAVLFKGGYTYCPGAKKSFEQLSTNGIHGFTDNFSLLGLEGIYRLNNWSLAIETSMGTQKSRSENNYILKPFTGAGHGSVGYIFYEQKDYWLYPSIGLGASVHNLSLKEKVYGKTNKIDNITSYAPSVDIAVNANLLTTRETPMQKNTGGLILGVKMGYRFSLKKAKWKNDNGENLQSAFEYRNNAYYVSLLAGFGMFKKK